MSETSNEDIAPFHSVVFGEGTVDEQRFSFAEFQQVPLRQRVRLLMGMPARFLSPTGVEIPRAQAMRFRDGEAEAKPEAPTSSAGDVEALARRLSEASEPAELRKGVEAALTVVARDRKPRAALAAGLLRAAELLHEQRDDRGTICAALRRFGELTPPAELGALYQFIRPGNHAEVMQAAMQAIWAALSTTEELGLGVLAVRARQLVNKFLDPDWLCLPVTQALAADCLLAYSVLAPSEEEPGMRALYKRARALAPALPIAYVSERINDALGFAAAGALPIHARLELLAELCAGEPPRP